MKIVYNANITSTVADVPKSEPPNSVRICSEKKMIIIIIGISVIVSTPMYC